MNKVIKIIVTAALVAGLVLLLIVVLQNFGIVGSGAKGAPPRGVSKSEEAAPDKTAPDSAGPTPKEMIEAFQLLKPDQREEVQKLPEEERMPAIQKILADQGITLGKTAVAVSVTKVETGEIRDYIKLNGDVISKKNVDIVSDRSGVITGLWMDIGRKVVKDDVIAEIDPSASGTSLARTLVKAPITGTISSLRVSVGNTVSMGSPLASVNSVENIQIRAFVPERYISSVRYNSEVELSFDAYPNDVFMGRVSAINPVVDSSSRTMEIRIDPLIPDFRIKGGMFSKIKLFTRISYGAMLVPVDCLVRAGDGYKVFVIKDDSAAYGTPVTLGIQIDGIAEVLSGLSPGDSVVTGGSSLVEDGVTVNIVKTLPPPRIKGTQLYPVRVTSAAEGELTAYVNTNGVVIYKSSVDVVSEVMGKVLSVLVSVGDRVEKGKLVAEIDQSKPGMQYEPSAVIATISGIVTSIPVQKGATIPPNTPVVKIGQELDSQIRIEVPERDLPFIQNNQAAQFQLDAYPETVFHASVSEINPEINSRTRTVEIKLKPAVPDERMKAGMSARVKILTNVKTQTVKIPRNALVTLNGVSYVYVLAGNTAVKREIQTGILIDDKAEIISGLSAGEVVILDAQGLPGDRVPVNVTEQVPALPSGNPLWG